ncbi:hypothetical protein BH23ACT9_BH23ACT9_04820 [soil metagenome]
MQLDDPDPIPVADADYLPAPMDQPDRRHLIPWEWWDGVGIYLVWVLLSGSAALAVRGLVGSDNDLATALGFVSVLVLLIGVTLAWLAVRGSARAGAGDAVRRAFGVKRVTVRDVGLGLGYGVLGFLVIQLGLGTLVQILIQAMGQEAPLVQQEVQQAVQGTGQTTLLVALVVVVMAPIGEELLFRGVLYQALAKHLSGWPAIGISGLAFGVTHGEPFVIVLTFPLGMGLAWTLRRHGTLVVPILAHIVFNLIGVVLIRGFAPT